MTNQPTLRLHGHPMSSNTRRVQLTLAHLGLPYEMVVVDLMSPDARAALRAINPNEKVPVLVHGDFVLWESCAIMQYLSELAPGQALYPYGVVARADINRWLFWHNAHFSAPLGALGWERVWKKRITGADPDVAAVARAEQLFASTAKVLDAHLASRTWISGDALSLADLTIAATLANAAMYGIDVAPYANITALCARVHALPAWAASEPPAMHVPPPAKSRVEHANVS